MSGAAEPRRTEPLKISGATGRRAPVSSAVTARPVPASNTAATDIAAVFIELEIAVRRAATLDELRFTMINAWQRLVPVDQAVLCEPARTTAFRATLAANVSAIDRYAPVVTMVDQWVRDRSGTEHRPADVHVGRLTGVDARDGETPVLHALWVPLKSREGDVLAAVVLLRRCVRACVGGHAASTHDVFAQGLSTGTALADMGVRGCSGVCRLAAGADVVACASRNRRGQPLGHHITD
jgi:hypothetical protein